MSEIYVTLPSNFIAMYYSGYFYNLDDCKLYSLKVKGVLKPLKHQKPSIHNHMEPGYQVSVHGYRRYISDKMIDEAIERSKVKTVIPVQKMK
jgi:hypothetical protein